MNARKLVLVGRVAGAFGVRGEMRITAYTQNPLALAGYGALLRRDGAAALTIGAARAAKGGVIARAAEITTKEAADALRGLDLYVRRDVLPPTEDEDEFYLTDLIGLSVRTVAGTPWASVKAVHDFGAGDVVELDAGPGRPTQFYAFTRDVFPEVDLDGGYLVFVPPAEIEPERAEDEG